MKTLATLVLAVGVGAFAATARADEETTKKLVGVWVIDKSGSDLPPGSTLEFTKDGKVNAVVKDASGDLKFDGTFTATKDKLTVKLKVMTETVEETVTIKKLTDELLEVEDKDKKVDTFKKKK